MTYVRADAMFGRQSCEASLRRLWLETIDLYYLHHRSDDIPVEETVGAMAELIQEGKIRGLGPSNVTEEDLRRAHEVHPTSLCRSDGPSRCWTLPQTPHDPRRSDGGLPTQLRPNRPRQVVRSQKC